MENCREGKYPSYDEVCKLIEKDIDLWAEYGEYNHECMETIWNNYQNKSVVKEMGEVINKNGGFQTMESNFYTLCKVLREILLNHVEDFRESREFEKQMFEQFRERRDNVKMYWDGVGNWKN